MTHRRPAAACGIDYRVQNGVCVACAPGTSSSTSDDINNGASSCAVTYCGVGQRVQSNACVACPAGYSNGAGDDASGPDTRCWHQSNGQCFGMMTFREYPTGACDYDAVSITGSLSTHTAGRLTSAGERHRYSNL